MITVSIAINGTVIFCRSAVRQEKVVIPGKTCTYKLDDGTVVKHAYDDGAVKLAIKMLKMIVAP